MNVIEYVTEEVTRQGHNVEALDGLLRVGWMLNAWSHALTMKTLTPTIDSALVLGRMIEPTKNTTGTRRCGVRVGKRICPDWQEVPRLLNSLFEQYDALTPIEFYKGFEEIHPFVDGNGRTGKILYCWKLGKLLDPEFPPNDIFGEWIENP